MKTKKPVVLRCECGESFGAVCEGKFYFDESKVDCLLLYKERPHRKPRSEYHGKSRSPSMGVWRNRQESILWEDNI